MLKKCFKNMEVGWKWAVKTKKSPQKKEHLRIGVDHRAILLEVGMAEITHEKRGNKVRSIQ
jgi:hypothetical protein